MRPPSPAAQGTNPIAGRECAPHPAGTAGGRLSGDGWDPGTLLIPPAACCTDHDGIVVGAADPQHHSCAQVLGPSLGQGGLPFIPHPANEAPQPPILAYVVEAGGNRHVQAGARLRRQGLESGPDHLGS